MTKFLRLFSGHSERGEESSRAAGNSRRLAHAAGFFSALRTILGGCVAGGGCCFGALPADVGPQSPAVDLNAYANVRYVDAKLGDDVTGDGSRAKPWASLPHALEQIGSPATNQRAALLVSAGRYAQPTFLLKPRVDLFGGFASPGGVRDVYAHATVLDGADTQRIAFGADDARVDGFHFVRGRVRGKGAALNCDGVSPTIANCIFTRNRTLMPEPWTPAQLHETAHDGGAIFCANGAAPRIEHSYFFENTTECGRGAAIAADCHARPRIAACVFANNRAGIDDPLRSSDGGAISFFDSSTGEVSGCVISANVALTRNDAGGIFIALWSAPRVVDSVLTANEAGDDAGALFIGGQEHRYGAPLDPIPPARDYNVVIERNVFVGNANASKNSGAMRVTMESRATFHDNLITENRGGFYLQRSEITAERNTIWQDWRFLEDKPSLGPSRLAGNIFKGPLEGKVEARVILEHNMAGPEAGGSGAIPVADVFENDGVAGKIAKVRFDAATCTTVLTVSADLASPSGELAGRPVGVGRGSNLQWRVVKSAHDRELVVWGRLEPETKPAENFTILRTFTLKRDAPAGVGARIGKN